MLLLTALPVALAANAVVTESQGPVSVNGAEVSTPLVLEEWGACLTLGEGAQVTILHDGATQEVLGPRELCYEGLAGAPTAGKGAADVQYPTGAQAHNDPDKVRAYGQGPGSFGAKGRGGPGVLKLSRSPVIVGAMSEEVASSVYKRNLNQLRYCYARALDESPELAGSLTLTLVVQPDGRVNEATVKDSTLDHEDVESCLTLRALRWKFPERDGEGVVQIGFPLQLGPEPPTTAE